MENKTLRSVCICQCFHLSVAEAALHSASDTAQNPEQSVGFPGKEILWTRFLAKLDEEGTPFSAMSIYTDWKAVIRYLSFTATEEGVLLAQIEKEKPLCRTVKSGLADMAQRVVKAPQFRMLLFELIEGFAKATFRPLPWNRERALQTFQADSTWVSEIPTSLHWGRLSGRFGEFSLATREIRIDDTLIPSSLEDPSRLKMVQALLLVKILHEFGNSLTKYCLGFLRRLFPPGTSGHR